MAQGDQGFASMDDERQREIASEGGKKSSGSFGEENSADPSKAGQKGAQNQPREAKQRGGEHSSRS